MISSQEARMSQLTRLLAEAQFERTEKNSVRPSLNRPTGPDKLRPTSWAYGDSADFRAGLFELLPDITGKRQLEGGTRLSGAFRPEKGPLVSIVTAIKDNPKSLQRCIDSVRRQTWGNIEHIVIDGDSDEPTLDIIRANANHLAYFVSEPDSGIYTAMNKGIAAAQGEYICLLNSDDFYDPEFVERALMIEVKNPGSIVYTDYFAGKSLLQAQEINEGILFGHLHICHNTFLVPCGIYDRVGPYDETYHIVSDAIWTRRAFLSGEQFCALHAPLFTLSDGGLSSGSNETHRQMFINEVVRSYRQLFPQLSEDEAREIYLFRFNKNRTKPLHNIASLHMGDLQIQHAIRFYVEHCMRDRNNFRLEPKDTDGVFSDYVQIADLLGIDRSCFLIDTKEGPLSEVIARIDDIVARRKSTARKTVLHFITVFSAPSETFVYDLLNRMDAEEDVDNFVLYEHKKLPDERPFDKAIQVFWSHFPEVVAGQIYKHLVERLKPDLVIAHFALNEWKWAQRTKELGIEIPTISMCHGIDAFLLPNKPDYRKHVVEHFSKRSDTAFTAVSEYLRAELLSNGVPSEKIHLLHNVVNDQFYLHRKTEGFYEGNRHLKLIAIGRLAHWKGHHILLQALAQFRQSCTDKVHLTIVYGNDSEQLEALCALAGELDLTEHVTFEPYVDFSRTPDYLAQFDLFIHPSIYSDDALKRSETFGVSVLEAITAGLPVITSDAGGLPEVIGGETCFAHIVPYGDAGALSAAMKQMWLDGSAFADNQNYAKDRLARFSSRTQMVRLRELIDEISRPRIRAALFSSSTVNGAGYAAFRVHRGLRETRIKSRLFTSTRNHENEPDVTVLEHPSGDNSAWQNLQTKAAQGLTIFTVNENHISNFDLMQMVEPYDVVNLHWHARFLSLDNIAALTRSEKPVVLTIRDMMPLTGGCHYFHGCSEWQRDCLNCFQMPVELRKYPATVLAMKRNNYDFSNLTLVAISDHTRKILEKAPVFRKCRIETIPNSIELDVFRPYDRNIVRKEFDIPRDRKVIGYVPSYSSEVKGYREFSEAMKLLNSASLGDDPYVMLMGQTTPATDAIAFDKKALGYISDNHRLARAYSCADVIVVPSLEETFSNTTAEAIACGVPVVGFRTGAISDLAVEGVSGVTCEVGDVAALAQGIIGVLTGGSLAKSCRGHAESMLSFMKQAKRYEALFEELADVDRSDEFLGGT